MTFVTACRLSKASCINYLGFFTNSYSDMDIICPEHKESLLYRGEATVYKVVYTYILPEVIRAGHLAQTSVTKFGAISAVQH